MLKITATVAKLIGESSARFLNLLNWRLKYLNDTNFVANLPHMNVQAMRFEWWKSVKGFRKSLKPVLNFEHKHCTFGFMCLGGRGRTPLSEFDQWFVPWNSLGQGWLPWTWGNDSETRWRGRTDLPSSLDTQTNPGIGKYLEENF